MRLPANVFDTRSPASVASPVSIPGSVGPALPPFGENADPASKQEPNPRQTPRSLPFRRAVGGRKRYFITAWRVGVVGIIRGNPASVNDLTVGVSMA